MFVEVFCLIYFREKENRGAAEGEGESSSLHAQHRAQGIAHGAWSYNPEIMNHLRPHEGRMLNPWSTQVPLSKCFLSHSRIMKVMNCQADIYRCD